MFSRLVWLEPLWILFLGIPIILPGKFLSLSLHPYILLALFLFWLIRWLANFRLITSKLEGTKYKQVNPKITDHENSTRQRSTAGHIVANSQSPIRVILFFILLWLPVNLWLSADRKTSWVAAGYLLFGITICMALINWMPTRRNPQLIAGLFIFISAVLATISPPVVAWKPQFRLFHFPLYSYLQSIPFNLGETIHANVLAGILVLALPLLFSIILQKSVTKELHRYRYLSISRVLYGLLFGLIFSILMLTQSRGGYLAAIVALPIVLILHWPRLLYLILVPVITVIIAIEQFGAQFFLEQLSGDGSLGGLDGRIYIWSLSLNTLHDFFLTGIGIGTFHSVIPFLFPIGVNIENFPHAHNLFLQVGLDLGLPGLIAYLALLFNLFAMLVWTLRTPQINQSNRTLAIGASGSLVAMLVHGLLDAVTWDTKLAFMPWLLFALITLLFLNTQNDQALPKA